MYRLMADTVVNSKTVLILLLAFVGLVRIKRIHKMGNTFIQCGGVWYGMQFNISVQYQLIRELGSKGIITH